jgi:hypothetical protein
MIGQFRPQTKVSRTSTVSWRRLRSIDSVSKKKPGDKALRTPSFDSTPWADRASYNQAMTFLNMLTAAT